MSILCSSTFIVSASWNLRRVSGAGRIRPGGAGAQARTSMWPSASGPSRCAAPFRLAFGFAASFSRRLLGLSVATRGLYRIARDRWERRFRARAGCDRGDAIHQSSHARAVAGGRSSALSGVERLLLLNRVQFGQPGGNQLVFCVTQLGHDQTPPEKDRQGPHDHPADHARGKRPHAGGEQRVGRKGEIAARARSHRARPRPWPRPDAALRAGVRQG